MKRSSCGIDYFFLFSYRTTVFTVYSLCLIKMCVFTIESLLVALYTNTMKLCGSWFFEQVCGFSNRLRGQGFKH